MKYIIILFLLSSITSSAQLITLNNKYRLISLANAPAGVQVKYIQSGYHELVIESTDTVTYEYTVDIVRKKKVWTTTPTPTSATIQAEAFKSKTSGDVIPSGTETVFRPIPGTKAVYTIPAGTFTKIDFNYSLASLPNATLTIRKNGAVIGTVVLIPTGAWGFGGLKTFSFPLNLTGGDIEIEFSRGMELNWFKVY